MSGSELRYRRFVAPLGGGAPSRFAPQSAGQSILITGAGGCIGSALAQAIAAAGPARLVLLDSSEHNLFQIHRRLEAGHEAVPRESILGSVMDSSLVNAVLDRFRPDAIYHAAALKHVSLLENNPFAAVRENAVGTYTLARAALSHGTPRVALVSTDKAVNPHSIMGASKRLAELTVAALSAPECRMNAVRLGNVIGSSGSVLPIFLEQISAGGPVTVTDPQASRYFLTLDEAVDAILAAGAVGCSGRILLPELSEPERIADLAGFLIGATPNSAGTEIPIRFIGLRPGEKLAEDLVFESETRDGTAGLLQAIVTPSPSPAELDDLMQELTCCLVSRDLNRLIRAISTAVPEYQPSRPVLDVMAVERRDA